MCALRPRTCPPKCLPPPPLKCLPPPPWPPPPWPPPPPLATATSAPTALSHRRLSAQIYPRAERNGHRKYFDKFDCHRRTPLRQENLRQSVEFHKQTFRIALAMSALGQKQTCANLNVRQGPTADIATLVDRINSLDICISSSRILLPPS